MKTTQYKSLIFPLILSFSGLLHASNELRLNHSLPINVDSRTEMSNVSIKDTNVTYTYHLKNIDKEKAKKLNKYLVERNACTDEKVQCLLKKDLDVTFVYKIDQEEVLNVNVNKDFCGELNEAGQLYYSLM